MKPNRFIARTIVGSIVVVLGVVSAIRLPVAFLPTWTFPEIQVRLSLSEAHEVDEVTRRWVLEIEAAARALGSVRDMAGFVDGRGYHLRMLLDPGSDPELKAARLESELERLRRDLPAGTGLYAWPAGGGATFSTVLWLPEDAAGSGLAIRALADEISALPSVREARLASERTRELRLRAHPGVDPNGLLEQARTAVGATLLGERSDSAGRRVRVQLDGHGAPLEEAWIRRGESAVRLDSSADLELAFDEAPYRVRFEGREGQAILIRREYEASPLALDRSLRRLLRQRGWLDRAELLRDEAQPSRLLIVRLLSAIGICSAWLFLGHGVLAGWRVGLAHATVPLLAAASSLVVCWLADFGLDVTTLPALLLAVGAAVLYQASRSRASIWAVAWVALFAAAVPVVVALAGGSLAASLASPIQLFALTAPVACAITHLVVDPPAPLRPRALLPLRFVLRRPWPVLLGGVSLAYFVFVTFGGALVPRPGSLSPAQADAGIEVRFPAETRVSEGAERLRRVERLLAEADEIRSYWSLVERGQARLGIWVEPEYRSVPRLRGLARRLELRLAGSAGSVRVVPLAGFDGREPVRFDTSLRARAERAEDQTWHRFLLRSTELASIRRAAARLRERLLGMSWRVTHEMVDFDWAEPVPRYELVPLPGAPSAQVDRAIARLRDRAGLGRAVPAAGRPPGDRRPLETRAVDAEAPLALDQPHARHFLLGLQRDGEKVLAVPGLFDWRETLSSPGLSRQAGTFVLPVTLRLSGLARGQVPAAVRELDSVLRSLELPAGVDIEVARDSRYWTPERLRMVGIGMALPILWLALAICRLNSWALGLAALAPPTIGLALSVPSIWASTRHVDEMTLLGLAAGLAAALPVVSEVAERARTRAPSRLAATRGYRWLGRQLPLALLAASAWAVLLAAPTWGLESDRFAWVPPLRAAAWAGSATILAGFLWLPVLLRAIDQVRFRDRQAARELAHPAVWQEPGSVHLAAQNLGKVYSNGFRALRSVSFELEPGIVGLLGPNGAGKTTLLRALCGLLEPSHGVVRYRGVPVRPENLPDYRDLVGFLPQSFNAYTGFTAEQFLSYWAMEKGIDSPRARRREVESLLEQVGLSDVARRRVRDFSGGMRRRIGIARALIGAPRILIVDEPTTGLDVESRNRLRESLLRAAGERIIIFSTHIASDVAAAASRILLLAGGRILFDGPANRLIEEAEGRVFETLVSDADLRELSGQYRITARVRTLDGLQVRAVAPAGIEPAGSIVRPNLEEAYLAKLGLGPQKVAGKRGPARDLLDLQARHG